MEKAAKAIYDFSTRDLCGVAKEAKAIKFDKVLVSSSWKSIALLCTEPFPKREPSEKPYSAHSG